MKSASNCVIPTEESSEAVAGIWNLRSAVRYHDHSVRPRAVRS